jgi:hypothetical protein
MKEPEKPAYGNDNRNQTQQGGKQEIIVNASPSHPETQKDKTLQGNSKENEKPTYAVRIVRMLWRRHNIRKGIRANGPHWAEITSMIITGGILIATCVQVWVYLGFGTAWSK